MSDWKFWKTETIGNDFVLLHESDVVERAREETLGALARALCDRNFGVGSDGLLIIGVRNGVLQQRMFNPDGTEDFCGNGLRCSALHAYRLGWVEANHTIEHFGRLVDARVAEDGEATVSIGPAVYDPEVVPLNRDLHPGELIDEEVCGYVGSAVNAGTTHFVTLVDELPTDREIMLVGPQIEHHEFFPDRTSIVFAKPVGERELNIRIWERGVGETLGCGTGSSAAAAVWMRKNDLCGEVKVNNPGGMLIVDADCCNSSLETSSYPHEPFWGTMPMAAVEAVKLGSKV